MRRKESKEKGQGRKILRVKAEIIQDDEEEDPNKTEKSRGARQELNKTREAKEGDNKNSGEARRVHQTDARPSGRNQVRIEPPKFAKHLNGRVIRGRRGGQSKGKH